MTTVSLSLAQGVAGLMVAVLRMLFKVMFATDEAGTRLSTYLYFGISLLVIVAGIVLFVFGLEQSPVTAYYLERAASAKNADTSSAASSSSSSSESYGTINGATVVPSPSPSSRQLGARAIDTDAEALIKPDAAADAENEARMWSSVRSMSISVFLVFWATLALFPGITSQLESTDPVLNLNSKTNPQGTGWFSIIMVCVFDLGDLIGRWLPNRPSAVIVGPRGVLICSVLRLMFFPLFVLHLKHYIVGDAWAYAIMFFFSLTNGYFATLSLMFASDAAPAQHKEYVGVLTVFALTLGLTSGVWTGVALTDLIGTGN